MNVYVFMNYTFYSLTGILTDKYWDYPVFGTWSTYNPPPAYF